MPPAEREALVPELLRLLTGRPETLRTLAAANRAAAGFLAEAHPTHRVPKAWLEARIKDLVQKGAGGCWAVKPEVLAAHGVCACVHCSILLLCC
jgi:hypothetical protein